MNSKLWVIVATAVAMTLTGCGKTWSYNAPEDDAWEQQAMATAKPSTFEGDVPPQIVFRMECQPDAKTWRDLVMEFGVIDEQQDGAKDYSGQEVEAKASVLAIEHYPITRVDGKAIYFEVPARSQFGAGTVGEAGTMSIDYPVYLKEEGWVRRYVKLRTSGLSKATNKINRECRAKYKDQR